MPSTTLAAHVYKKAAPRQPEPLSFVKAVRNGGDKWRMWLPLDARVGHYDATRTADERDFDLMLDMEHSMIPRVGDLAEPSDRDILPGFNCMWTAVRGDYDGAPDSSCPSGSGYTKYQAIADLLDAEELRAETKLCAEYEEWLCRQPDLRICNRDDLIRHSEAGTQYDEFLAQRSAA